MNRASVFSVLVFVVISACGDIGRADGCEKLDNTSLDSPDGRWIASAYIEVCDLGISASAAYVVELHPADDPDAAKTVLGISSPDNESETAVVVWNSSTELAIFLPSGAELGTYESRYRDVAVNVQFCTAESAEREKLIAWRSAYEEWIGELGAWNARRKNDPQSVGPKPMPPAGPPPAQTPVSNCSSAKKDDK